MIRGFSTSFTVVFWDVLAVYELSRHTISSLAAAFSFCAFDGKLRQYGLLTDFDKCADISCNREGANIDFLCVYGDAATGVGRDHRSLCSPNIDRREDGLEESNPRDAELTLSSWLYNILVFDEGVNILDLRSITFESFDGYKSIADTDNCSLVLSCVLGEEIKESDDKLPVLKGVERLGVAKGSSGTRLTGLNDSIAANRPSASDSFSGWISM
jgi:hypothetical protein